MVGFSFGGVKIFGQILPCLARPVGRCATEVWEINSSLDGVKIFQTRPYLALLGRSLREKKSWVGWLVGREFPRVLYG